MPYALFLFIAVPIIEIALLLRVSDSIGWISTLLVVIATAIIGSAMLRQQGLATMNLARQRLDAGEMPAQQLLEGMMIMIGGVLLLTPGFVTDTIGFLCLIPFSRQWLAGRLSARVMVGVAGKGGGFSNQSQRGPAGVSRPTDIPGSAGTTGQSPAGSAGDIIDGDFKVLDDD